jgi:TRAP-type C4-dicarboxylate transport system substrate-binding protein
MNMPYIWDSDAERVHVTDKFVLPVLQELYVAKGLVLFSVSDVGWNDVVCTFACLSPADVKGQKMRISPSPASKLFFTALGVNGVQMPLTELFPGLQTGLVKGADLPFLYYITTPAAQSAPHYVLTRHYQHPSAWIVNKGLYDKMTADEREKLNKAMPPVAETRKRVEDAEQPKMKEFVAKGGFVHQLTAAQREEWAKLVRPVQAELVKTVGGRSQEVYDAMLRGKKDYAEKFGKKN